jgi:CheY-like chemotaxis protein
MSIQSPVVLLVETDRDALAMHAIGLLALGLQPVTADNAADGLERARRLHPDVIVTDMRLPDISGLEFARLLRDDIRTRRSAIILATTDASPETARQASEAGCDRCVVTPCQALKLAHEIASLLRSRLQTTVASSGAHLM